MRRFQRAVSLLLLLLEAACVSGSGREGQARSSGSSITGEELAGLPPLSVHQAVERLRPNWLRGRVTTVRGVAGQSYFPRVFIDGIPSGEIQRLHELNSRDVREIRFLSASDATTRFGTGYPGGVIEVLMKRGGGGPAGTG